MLVKLWCDLVKLRGDPVKPWGDRVKLWGELVKLWGGLVKLWGGLAKLWGTPGPRQGASRLAAQGHSEVVPLLGAEARLCRACFPEVGVRAQGRHDANVVGSGRARVRGYPAGREDPWKCRVARGPSSGLRQTRVRERVVAMGRAAWRAPTNIGPGLRPLVWRAVM